MPNLATVIRRILALGSCKDEAAHFQTLLACFTSHAALIPVFQVDQIPKALEFSLIKCSYDDV